MQVMKRKWESEVVNMAILAVMCAAVCLVALWGCGYL
jgi:hypothetical protein